MNRRRRLSFLAWAALAFSARAEPPPDLAVYEIEHLLSYLAKSGCEFSRNGKWYPSAKAEAHLRRKYRYLVEKDLVNSAEQFVERAATGSSQSGQPYQVRCQGNVFPSAVWLTQELQRYRERSRR